MTKTLSLLLAATALSAVIAVPAWSAMRAAMPETAQAAPQLILTGGDEEDDDHEYVGNAGKRESDHDDDNDNEDDDDCEDDGGACGGAMNPAPSGKAPAPDDGLFGKGEPPKAQIN